MKRIAVRIGALVVALSIAALIGWTLSYPSESDPKNIKYILWKNGLYRMDLDTATGTMIGDAGREKLVLGETKPKLREKFGYLSTLEDVSPYFRGCYQNSSWKGADILFIRNGPWMVVFNAGKATDLVLIKGC